MCRPKGWHATASGTEVLDPDLQIGDPVFQSLLSPREEEHEEDVHGEEEEEESGPVGPPAENMVDTHYEMASVNKPDETTSVID